MHGFQPAWWRKTPALKGLLPLAPGIVVQWYYPIPLSVMAIAALVILLLGSCLHLLSNSSRFRLQPVQGVLLNLLLALTGMFLVAANDVRNKRTWFHKTYRSSDHLLVQLEDSPVEKPKSFKAVATVHAILRNDSMLPCTGKIILYLKKDDDAKNLRYGTQLVVHKKVAEIKPPGNPAAFDYKRYSLFQGITHQVYLTATDYRKGVHRKRNHLKEFLIESRHAVLSVMKKYIRGEKDRGLAEALLIGYKDNLDRSLVQSYAHTGVVHVIAISGLHLGLIYGILVLLTRPLHHPRWRWFRTIVIVGALWLFSLLAGAQASVLRSAVMFTAIALSLLLHRKALMYNNLALSAFLLLCYQPFWLWDVGFQLSYCAVLSILAFYAPVYRMFYFRNKAVDAVWKLAAVTLAAQILTTPLSLFHFHQFPVFFLITNLVAVPVSSMVLIGEIILCCLCFFPPLASGIAFLLQVLIRFMNDYIERVDALPFSRWEPISVSPMQVACMYLFIAGLAFVIRDRSRHAAWLCLLSLITCVALRSLSVIEAGLQRRLVVYQVPGYQAIDVVCGRKYYFIGDHAVENGPLRQFHMQPARLQARTAAGATTGIKAFRFQGHTVMILDHAIRYSNAAPLPVDVLILSGRPNIDLQQLHPMFPVKQVVIDSSVPHWLAIRWKEQCRWLQIPCHDVTGQGAFVMKLQTPTFAAS